MTYLPSPTFSLTERYVINPVLYLRADPLEQQSLVSRVWHLAEKEVVGRAVTLVATPIFATLDSAIHLGTGCAKVVGLLAGRCCHIPTSWTGNEVAAHFRKSLYYLGIALLGWPVAAVLPELFNKLGRAPFALMIASRGFNDQIPADLPSDLYRLACNVRDGKETAPFAALKTYWENASLEQKHLFVLAFNLDVAHFDEARKTLQGTVYREPGTVPSPQSLNTGNPNWFTEPEVSRKLTGWHDQATDRGYYYHATPTLSALESILRTECIQVRHEKAYKGAFASTRPEMLFGPYGLVLRRNIERISGLNIGFPMGNSFWAGFSRDIPVTAETLAGILIDSGDEEERADLEKRCFALTGRKIEVLTLNQTESRRQQIAKMNMGIPEEWGCSPEATAKAALIAPKILHTMARRVSQQLQINMPDAELQELAQALAEGKLPSNWRWPVHVQTRREAVRVAVA